MGKSRGDLKKRKKITAGKIPAVIFSDSERFLQLQLQPLWVKMRGGQIGDDQTADFRALREIIPDQPLGIRQLACRHRQDPSGGVSGRRISSFCRRTSRKISVLIFAPFFSAIKPMGKVKAGSSPGDCPWRKIRRPGFPISGSAPVALFAFLPVLFSAPYTKKGGTSGGARSVLLFI